MGRDMSPSLLLILCALLISQVAFTNCTSQEAGDVITDELLLKRPLVSHYFKFEDLKLGNSMRLTFPVKSRYEPLHFFSNKIDDTIPFSSKYLPQLLRLFSFSESSKQGKAVADTLDQCEHTEHHSFCSTSLESMVESVHGVLGLDADINVLTTKLSPEHKVDLQNYTILGEPSAVATPKFVGCHPLAYPYRVYLCHPQLKDPMVFKVPMVGADGERILAMAVCHRNTSSWDPEHISFKKLNTQPGKSTICHYMPVDHLAWVSSSTNGATIKL